MSINAAAMRMLVDKGFTGEDLVALALCLEKAFPLDTTHEKRKAYDRQRKRDGRANSTGHSTGNPPDPAPNEIDNLTPTRGKTETNVSSKTAEPWALPVDVGRQVWTDLLANRKRKRLGNTPTAWKAFLDDLNRVSIQTGIPPPQLIEQCTAKGWGAIYDPRDERNERSTNGMGRHQPNDGLSQTTRAARDVFGLNVGRQ
jgi:hypothetical protein